MAPSQHLSPAVVVQQTAAASGVWAWVRQTRVGRARTGASLVVAVTLLVLTVLPASGHTGGDPDVRLVLDDLPEALAGMSVQLADRLAYQVVVSNPTQTTIEVMGITGRPFLRIGPEGVEANLAVADWYTTNDPFGATVPPDDVDGPDRWGLVSRQPTWGWYDHRLHPGPITPPEEIVARGQPADFGEWSIPVQVDGVTTAIAGAYRFQPLRGTYVAEISTPPADPAITMAVLPGPVPGLFLDNTGDQTIVVLGVEGEPFLRFDPSVGVEANLRSRSWLDSARAADGTTPESIVDATAAPEWSVISGVPRLGWIDPRTRPDAPEPAADIVAAGVPAVVTEWQVQLEGEGPVQVVEGVTTWQPLDDAEPQPIGSQGEAILRWLAVAGVAALGVGGLMITRRRERR